MRHSPTFCSLVGYGAITVVFGGRDNSTLMLALRDGGWNPQSKIITFAAALSEAVKKCTTMAGSVAPPGWLRYGWPQTQ